MAICTLAVIVSLATIAALFLGRRLLKTELELPQSPTAEQLSAAD